MGFFWALIGVVILVVAVFSIFVFLTSEIKPPQPKSGWWGSGPVESDTDTAVKEFKVLACIINSLLKCLMSELIPEINCAIYVFWRVRERG